MATPRKGLPEVWTSGLAQYLCGESPCGYRYWFKAKHKTFEKMPNTFDSAAWKIQHTDLLKRIAAQYEADGWKCRLEVYVRVTGKTGILTGKIDVIAQKGGVTKVIDAKSGEPKDSHAVQVAIYLVALPMAWETPNLFTTGEVIYADGTTVEVGPEQAAEWKGRIFAGVRELSGAEPVVKRPGELTCRFCELVPTDCPERVGDTPMVATTELF